MRNTMACLVALVLLSSPVEARSPVPTGTRITVSELCCKSCVKKVAARLVKVPGVASVQGDLNTASLLVTHRPGANPSPRALWEAVEQADHVPTRLDGPSGTFTTKPQS